MTKKSPFRIKTAFSLPTDEKQCPDCKKTWFEDNPKKCPYCGSKKVGVNND